LQNFGIVPDRHTDYRLANIAQQRHEYPSHDPAHCSRGYKDQPDDNQELSDNDQEYPLANHEPPRPHYAEVVLPNTSPISGVILGSAHGFTPEGYESEGHVARDSPRRQGHVSQRVDRASNRQPARSLPLLTTSPIARGTGWLRALPTSVRGSVQRSRSTRWR
jgi:hypothetical protein